MFFFKRRSIKIIRLKKGIVLSVSHYFFDLSIYIGGSSNNSWKFFYVFFFNFSVKLFCLFSPRIIFPWCDLFPFVVSLTLWNIIMDKKSYRTSRIDLIPKIFFSKKWKLHNVKYRKQYSILLHFVYIRMFKRQNSNLLSHYDISISNIYFNHLWLMFKKVSQ